MQLQKIKLAGFKSFVDPTTLELPSQLIGVVGPNGCGKSNVIDAVRWVMGESSAKNLRGDSLADVIFNGSSGRKPVGSAMVELVFNNSQGRLGGEYAKYAELSVKRKINREGKSNYYLNGTKCRRRDITDVFLGTGLGPRSYSIIEQGMISRLIEAKPEELRVFIEEAAGISKYKERRRETETRIRHTKENISRIDDLAGELDKRLQTLQRQAKTAEKYKILKQDERLVKAQLLALRHQGLDGEAQLKDKAIQGRETALEGLIAVQRATEAEIEKQRVNHAEANEHFNNVQGQFYSIGADIARVEQLIQHMQEKREENQLELEHALQTLTEGKVHIEHDQRQIEEINASLETCDPQFEVAEAQAKISTEALQEVEERQRSWQDEWESFNSTVAVKTQQSEVERTRIIHLEEDVARQQKRLQRQEEEFHGLDAGDLKEEVATLNEQSLESSAQLEGLQQEVHGLLSDITQQREANSATTHELTDARSHLVELQKTHASLDALQKAALGKQAGAVTDWLEAHGLDDARRLAETLEVENGWERAVEAVLGQHIEALCVEGVECVTDHLASLQQGALSLFDTQAKSASESRPVGMLLSSKVKAIWSLEGLFSGIYAVDTVEDALALRSQLQAQESVVTRDGVWVGCDWLRVIRGSDEEGSVLLREQELKLVLQNMDEADEHLNQLEQALEEGQLKLATLEEQRETLQQNINQVAHKNAEVRAQLSSKNARLEQVEARKQRLQGEMEEIQAQSQKGSEALVVAREHLELMIAEMAAHHEQRADLGEQREALRLLVETSRQQAQADRDTAREFMLRIDSMRTQLGTLTTNSERMQRQMGNLERRRDELTSALEEGVEPLETSKMELEAYLEKRLLVEGELAEVRRQVEACDHELRQLGGRRSEVEQQVLAIRAELEQMRMAWQEIKVRRQTLQEQIDESQYTLAQLIAEMPEAANEAEWAQQAEALERRIQRLGAINLAAIEEYTEQSERKNYLDAQLADLGGALETLESAIRKIDHETRTRFKDTFEKVDDKLQELFPRLFGGGSARLEMTSDDVLDAGVTVMAHPPGKRNSSIHLLSGGEKALTAVAMVFAIFELNPAPFCILDEVDAPLDDNNTIRFSQMVKEMSDRVQFIFITHNKITMEISNQLVGVTMHEPGVSRLVAVDVAEAMELVEAV